MATVYQVLEARAGIPAATNGAQHDVISGTNFPIPVLAYDGGSTDESAFFYSRALNYGSGNITIDIDWYADTATSGDVVWGAQIAAITPNTDTQDIETDALATANTVTDSHLGTTGQRLHRCSITLSNLDSIASGDWFVLHIYRDASDTGTDTMTGDAYLVMLTLSYSDA